MEILTVMEFQAQTQRAKIVPLFQDQISLYAKILYKILSYTALILEDYNIAHLIWSQHNLV